MNATANLLRFSKWWAIALLVSVYFFHYGDVALLCGRSGGAPDFCEPAFGIALWLSDADTRCVPLVAGSDECREYWHGLFFVGVGSPAVQSVEAVMVALVVIGCISAGMWQLWVALRGDASQGSQGAA